jgi:hypothetical protein
MSSPTTAPILTNGKPLPAGCDFGRPAESQTVAFAAGGRDWALDPSTGQLSCLLEDDTPGPFLWGPRGDRVLLGGFRIAGLLTAPSYNATGIEPTIADWGHPIGIAIVFAQQDATRPQKFFLETNKTETLRDLPKARYLDVAYHPSGLALGFVLERRGSQSIWISTNEGQDAKRLVFTKEGTTFSDVTFTHDGESLVYVAHHAEGYSELHAIDLARPDTLNSVWKGPVGEYLRTVSVSPNDGRFAGTEGQACDDSRAVLLQGSGHERLALPQEQRPTEVLGWLDGHTYLVAAGGCGAPTDLYAVGVGPTFAVTPLATGVDAAASRAAAPSAPSTVPKEVQLDTGSGVG